MNRMLLIPCVASCLGFVLMAGASRVELAGHGYRSIGNENSLTSGDAKAGTLKSLEQVQEGLITKWKKYNEEKYAFSRVYRPEQRYSQPGILVDDSVPAPEGSFVGLFTLQDSTLQLLQAMDKTGAGVQEGEPKLEFPIVIDRRTGEAIVFASGKWTDFNHWAVTGQ